MRTGLAALALIVATAGLVAGGAAAKADVDAQAPSAESLYRLAQADEEASAFAQALLHDRATITAAPDSVWAQRAADRIAWLDARSEGDFAPLARLEAIRRNPALGNDPAAIEALARDAEAFPPGLVRVEARMFVAEAWLGRMHRPDDGLAKLRLVRDDEVADPLTARLAERELVEALVEKGDIDEAADEAKAHANRLDPNFVKQTHNLARRRTMRAIAIAELWVFGVLAMVAFLRARRRGALGDIWHALRGLAPVAIGFAVYVAVMGGVLASQYEAGRAAPFYLFALCVLPMFLIARGWGAVGSSKAWARAARAVLCAISVLAAAFVLLDAVNPTYLEGFGL